MKITVLSENTTLREDLPCEHGLSLYIEAVGKKLLFDAGASENFAENAKKLGIDLSQVDIAILSHGHNDHSGGLLRFLQENEKAPVYLRPEAYLPYYGSSGAYIGLDPRLQKNSRLKKAAQVQQLGEGLTLYSCNNRAGQEPLDTAGLTVRLGEESRPDDFLHEQYLLIREGEKQVLISGCSHKGILNIAGWFRPDALVGGFHYMRVDPADPKLLRAARTLLSYPSVYYTGHCTGQAQYAVMKCVMADRLHSLSTGMTVTL